MLHKNNSLTTTAYSFIVMGIAAVTTCNPGQLVEITAADRIVTMSTCRYDVTNGRYAVFGKLVKIG